MNYFWADTRFGHERLAEIRGFDSAEQMDDELSMRWNNTVDETDTVYIIGDLSFAKEARTRQILQGLKGNKRLVVGNHDKAIAKRPHRYPEIEVLGAYHEVKHNKELFVLCHYGMEVWRNSHHGSFMLHGHSHGSLQQLGRRQDVGVDVFDAPVSIDTLADLLRSYAPHVADYHGAQPPSHRPEHLGPANAKTYEDKWP